MIIVVLDDVPPSHLNKNEDVDSWSPSQSSEEEEPTPKKIKQNKEKIEKPQKKNRKKEMAENK